MTIGCRMLSTAHSAMLFSITALMALTPPSLGQDGSGDLYDLRAFRTIELDFTSPDFFAEIDRVSNETEDGYVVGTCTFEGERYEGVGVRFRGNTSQRNAGEKRSFKIAIDHEIEGQRLWGYRTLKLNNSASDPTFLREVLFSRIQSRYSPTPVANLVKLVINGENWGVYVNVQQFNKDFLGEWFARTGGSRWKSPSGGGTGPGGASEPGGGVRPPRPPGGGPAGGGAPGGGFAGGDRALTWRGTERSSYDTLYELKTDDTPAAWAELISFCDGLNNVAPLDSESAYAGILDVDGALWAIAMENVFVDEDGYLFKGADYTFYISRGRLFIVQHDANETFRDPESFTVLDSADDPNRPLVRQLLAVPQLRARYLAHVRTLLDQSLQWEVIGPLAQELHDMIAAEVASDTKKLFSTEFFHANLESSVNLPAGPGGGTLPGLREFVTRRRAFLLPSPELQVEVPGAPGIELSLTRTGDAWEETLPGETVDIRVVADALTETVLVHHAGEPDAPFDRVSLADDGLHEDGAPGDGVWGGVIPAYPGGTTVRFYVEARGAEATRFEPREAERGALTYRVGTVLAESTPVVINELMARNSLTVSDPQGEFDDWVELLNITEDEVDVSGMFLSDNLLLPRKWRIPDGTVLPARSYLLVFCDEDGSDPGLHANFKLSGSGEEILLVDTDERLNAVLDHVQFGELPEDVAWGRRPDGYGEFEELPPTPLASNEPHVPRFRRGDANGDAQTNLSDAVAILDYLFVGRGALLCESAADVDDNDRVDLTDSVYLLGVLFLGRSEPPSPFAACGIDPTPGTLSCAMNAGCE